MFKSRIARSSRACVLILLAAVAGMLPLSASAQTPKQVTPPLSQPRVQYFKQHPEELQQLRDRLSQAAQQFRPAQVPAGGVTPSAGAWTTLTNAPPGGAALQNPLLMTDGTVIAMGPCTGQWYKLTPDITGSYVNGTWTTIAKMPSGYAPLFGGSAVLPDGRVVFEGGEYNDAAQSGTCGNPVDSSKGAIYDPVANTWTAVNPPGGWTSIGDGGGIVLDNGTFMQGSCCQTSGISGLSALLHSNTLTWTTTGSGKLDAWDEEGMAKLQNGGILNVDAHTNNACGPFTSELYNQSAGTWSATGNTVDQQADCSNPTSTPSFELGPLVTRQDGSAIIFPGLTCHDDPNGNGNTDSRCVNQSNGFVVTPKADLYNVGAGTWSTLVTMPRIGTAPSNYFYSLADAPAAVLPDGNILFAASPDYEVFVNPTHYFELNFGTNTITQVGDTADAASNSAFEQNFLLLPTGQVLAVSQSANVQIYTPLAGSPQANWAPAVTSAPSCVVPGVTYALQGTQLNGLTEGSYYGDDVQAAVNFPVVQIVNNSTGHVFYAKTFNHSSRSIAPGMSASTSFTVAGGTETGASTLHVISAGIASTGIPLNVSASPCIQNFTVSVSETGSGTVTSSPSGINCSSNTGTCNNSFASGTNLTLTATPLAGWIFSGWGGACTGNSSCAINVTQNTSVTATFTQSFALSVSVTGSGTVASSPSGISCPSGCSQSYAAGTGVTLTATPASGSIFAGWGGACSGSGSCIVNMTQPQSVGASFKSTTVTSLSSSPNPSAVGQAVTLTATVTSGSGTPTGTVTFSDGALLNGSAPLANGVATFSTSTLSAGSHSITASYSGDANSATSASSPLTQTVLSTFTLSVSASPSAGGNVCCSGSFAANSAQTVTASPSNGYRFTNWTQNGSVVSTSASYSFTLAGNTTLVANFLSITAHDFNGDGKSDVLWLDSFHNVGMWLMNGNQVQQAKVLGSVSSNWSIVGQRDFNGDGNADILWRNSAGDVGMWLMSGTNVVSSPILGNVANVWSVVGTGDFNGDGKADILWLDNANNVAIWLMNGTQVTQAGVLGQLPANWTVVGSDMKGNIFFHNTLTGDLGMWVMNGLQVVKSVDLGPVPLIWSVAGIGDFDGNGSSDILLRDTSGNVQIWFLNGTQVLSTPALGNVPSVWSIAATGEFNGDGKSDILWEDNDGDVGVWFMNGAAVSSFIYGNVSKSWTVQSLNAD